MAKVKMPLNSQEASGLCGELVYYRHREINVVRPKTPKGLYSWVEMMDWGIEAATKWKTLLESERESWREYASGIFIKDRFRNIGTLPGFNIYVQCYCYAKLAEETPLDEAPTASPPGPIVSPAISWVAAGGNVVASWNTAQGAKWVNTWFSSEVSPGATPQRNHYTNRGVALSTGGSKSIAGYTANKKVGIRFRLVSAGGQLGPFTRAVILTG